MPHIIGVLFHHITSEEERPEPLFHAGEEVYVYHHGVPREAEHELFKIEKREYIRTCPYQDQIGWWYYLRMANGSIIERHERHLTREPPE